MVKYNFIDFFSGAGGLSYGFEKAGFNLKLAIEKNPNYKKTFNSNHLNKVFKEFELSFESVEELRDLNIDLIIGSPPCQGFSDARGCRHAMKKKDKVRNSLSFVFLKIVEYLQPKMVLLENVKGLSTYKSNGSLILNRILEKFDKINYDVCYEILNAIDFGIPQNRERIFFLAAHKDFRFNPTLTKKTILQNLNLKGKKCILRDVFSDLPLKINGNSYYTKKCRDATDYQKLMRKDNINVISNHDVLVYPNDKELNLIQKIPQGKVYRSSRFGDRYIGVWELYKNQLLQDERELLLFLCKKRTLNEYKELKTKYQEGYLRIDKFPTDKDGKFYSDILMKNTGLKRNRSPQEIIDSLIKKGFVRKRIFEDGNNHYFAYDINTKSGIRPKYRRLSYQEPCSTIQTVSFKVNELIHPEANRPLTFREGARIQSFPDNFIFYGSKADITTMIGNAVPPLMAYHLGLYIHSILDYLTGKEKSINFSKELKISI